MLLNRINLQCLITAICIATYCIPTANAKEIILQHKGLKLNAELELADGKSIGEGVILITHGALGHRSMETIEYMRKLIKEHEYNTLAINLSLGITHRHGMYNCENTHRHKNQDAIEEIGIWVTWLKHQGVEQVTLLGHSRGGAQTALYAVKKTSQPVKSLVLLAPATAANTSAAAYKRRYNLALEPLLHKAKQMVSNGKSEAVLEHVGLLTCRDTSATADTFVSYYDQNPQLDLLSILPDIEAPTLVIVAGDDRVVVDLDKKLEPILGGSLAQMKVVDGADHMFRDLYADDAKEMIHEFLQSLSDNHQNKEK